jgi:hypothetical protein
MSVDVKSTLNYYRWNEKSPPIFIDVDSSLDFGAGSRLRRSGISPVTLRVPGSRGREFFRGTHKIQNPPNHLEDLLNQFFNLMATAIIN